MNSLLVILISSNIFFYYSGSYLISFLSLLIKSNILKFFSDITDSFFDSFSVDSYYYLI